MARRIASGFDDGHEAYVSDGDWDSLYWSFRHLQGREAWQVNGALLQRYQPPLGPDVAARFAWCAQVTDGQVSIAQRSRERLRERMQALLGEDGVLLLPTMPDCAPLRSAAESSLETYRETALRMTCIAGLAGLPQVTMPLGRSGQAPLGLSLMGPAHSDRSLLRTVSALVQEVG
jgi:amidase